MATSLSYVPSILANSHRALDSTMSDLRSCTTVSAWPLHSITNLDAAVAHLKEDICAIQSRRNIMATINARLPNEVLGEIFLCLVRQGWEARETEHYERNLYRWLVVTFICRHWRDVALNTPSLWAYNTAGYRKGDRFMEFLRRSKDSPLTIRWASNADIDLDIILNEVRRIRSLDGAIGTSAELVRIHKALSHAPLLRVLNLRRSYDFKTVGQTREPVGPSLTPVLEMLYLEKPTEHMLRTFVCPHLTDLRLTGFGTAVVSLEALRKFPLLKKLHIVWNNGTSLVAQPSRKRIPLLHLRDIFLYQHQDWRNCSYFFQLVTLPSSARINLWVHASDPNTEDYASFYQALASIRYHDVVGSPQYPVECHVNGDRRVYSNYETTIWYGEPLTSHFTGPRPSTIDEDGQLYFKWSGDNGSKASLAFLSHTFSSHLRFLKMQCFDINREGWRSMTALAGLHEIETDSLAILSALQLLSPDSSTEPSERSSGKIPLSPHLETLTLLHIDWRMHAKTKAKLSIGKLRTFLESRRRKGYPLKKLCLEDGLDMCPKQLESLKNSETDLVEFSWTFGDKSRQCHGSCLR